MARTPSVEPLPKSSNVARSAKCPKFLDTVVIPAANAERTPLMESSKTSTFLGDAGGFGKRLSVTRYGSAAGFPEHTQSQFATSHEVEDTLLNLGVASCQDIDGDLLEPVTEASSLLLELQRVGSSADGQWYAGCVEVVDKLARTGKLRRLRNQFFEDQLIVSQVLLDCDFAG